MARLIDADELRQTIESNLYWGVCGDGAFLDTIDEAPTVDAVPVVHGRWIPVEERLPDKDGDYLVFKRFDGKAWSDVVSFAKDGRKVSECTFGKKWPNVWYYYDSEWGYIRTDAVTHWMPLPEPPKEE